MKVFELAKELGISNKKLMSIIHERGIEVNSHLGVLDEKQVEDIKEYLNANPIDEDNELLKENKELKERLAKMEAMLQSLMVQQNTNTKEDNDDVISEIPMNKTVKVMSLFSGGLNLKTSNDSNATVFRFNFVGETYPIIYSDLVKIIANQRKFFKEGYCMILDKDVVKAHYLEDDYKRFVDGKVINNILEYETPKIKEIFSNVTKVIQQSIVDVVVNKINNNEYVDKNKVAVISELYGHDLYKLADKLR